MEPGRNWNGIFWFSLALGPRLGAILTLQMLPVAQEKISWQGALVYCYYLLLSLQLYILLLLYSHYHVNIPVFAGLHTCQVVKGWPRPPPTQAQAPRLVGSGHAIKVSNAPQPSEVLWQNQDVPWWSRLLRHKSDCCLCFFLGGKDGWRSGELFRGLLGWISPDNEGGVFKLVLNVTGQQTLSWLPFLIVTVIRFRQTCMHLGLEWPGGSGVGKADEGKIWKDAKY